MRIYLQGAGTYLGDKELTGLAGGRGWRGEPGDRGREGAADLTEPAGELLILASRSSLTSSRSSCRSCPTGSTTVNIQAYI